MSILSDPIDDQAIREGGFVRFITDNVRNYKKPYIGFTEDAGVKSLQHAGKNLFWKPNMLSVIGDILEINKKRAFVCGQFDWDKYGITTIYGGVLIFEQCNKAIPGTISANVVYFNDNYDYFKDHYIHAMSVVFTKFWYGNGGGVYDVEFDCGTISFNDPPKEFVNVTGHCGKIIFRCSDFADVPGLRNAVIKQTINGKKIEALKDIRAYVNNPKKYPQEDPTSFFDVGAFIEASGLSKLEGLVTVTIMDSGIRFDFNKPTDLWMCTHIERL